MDKSKRRVLFIDSADPKEVETALKAGFQGITTNPSLVGKVPKGDASKPFVDRYVEHMCCLADIARGHRLADGSYPSLSVEVFTNESDEMVRQASGLAERIVYENLAIKVPVSYIDRDNLSVIKELSDCGFRVNATCGFSVPQLTMAAQAGARFVSYFYNRAMDYYNGLSNSRGDGQELALRDLRELRGFIDGNPGIDAEIIFGSIRRGYDVTNGWANGADIVTAGYKVVPEMMRHPATDKSVDGFLKDLQAWMS